jgi:hypothetical protein
MHTFAQSRINLFWNSNPQSNIIPEPADDDQSKRQSVGHSYCFGNGFYYADDVVERFFLVHVIVHPITHIYSI